MRKVHIRLYTYGMLCPCSGRASGFFLSTEPASCFGHFSLYWYMGLLAPFHFFLNSHDYKEPISDFYETLPELYHGLQST